MLRQPIKWKSHCVCAFILWLYIKCTGMASVMPFQIKQVNTTTKLTIGSDPEFYFVRLNESKTKEELLQAVDILENSTNASLGVDGCQSIGEMRPKYGNTVSEHIANILKLMKKLNEKTPIEYKVCAGSGKYKPIGGHIHFGLKNYNDRLIKKLDAVSLFYLFLEERDYNIKRRCESVYGHLGSVRDQPHGFEYRTPSSWLVSPLVARGMLSTYYAVVKDHMMGVKNKYLYNITSWMRDYEIEQSYNRAHIKVFAPKFKMMVRAIRNLSMYQHNVDKTKDRIESIIALMKQGKHWNEDKDLLTRWKFRNFIQQKLISERCFFKFNTEDEYLGDMEQLINRHPIYSIPMNESKEIFVFGLNEKRGILASSDSLEVCTLLRDVLALHNIKGEIMCKPMLASSHSIELGLSKKIRKNSSLMGVILDNLWRNKDSIPKKQLNTLPSGLVWSPEDSSILLHSYVASRLAEELDIPEGRPIIRATTNTSGGN